MHSLKKASHIATTAFLFLASILTSLDAAQAQTIELHKPSDKPIHIGEGRGKFDDIPYKDQSLVPSTKKSWSVNLGTVPTTARASIHMYSLTDMCPSVLAVNGKEVVDMAKAENVGSGKDTKISVNIAGNIFRAGENTISIIEKECHGGGINDSLIKSVIVDIR